MGSNRRPKGAAGTIRVRREVRLTQDTGQISLRTIPRVGNGNGLIPATPRRFCRTFGLVHRTASADRAATGMHIWGEVDGQVVHVHSGTLGQLGDVPSQESKLFISERIDRGGGKLTGFILKTTPHDVRVKLCIN